MLTQRGYVFLALTPQYLDLFLFLLYLWSPWLFQLHRSNHKIAVLSVILSNSVKYVQTQPVWTTKHNKAKSVQIPRIHSMRLYMFGIVDEPLAHCVMVHLGWLGISIMDDGVGIFYRLPLPLHTHILVLIYLTHWGRVTHICVSNLTIISSDNGLSAGRRQAIIWTNAGILLIRPLETNFSEILIKFHTFSFKKIHLKTSSGKWRPCCLGLN